MRFVIKTITNIIAEFQFTEATIDIEDIVSTDNFRDIENKIMDIRRLLLVLLLVYSICGSGEKEDIGKNIGDNNDNDSQDSGNESGEF